MSNYVVLLGQTSEHVKLLFNPASSNFLELFANVFYSKSNWLEIKIFFEGINQYREKPKGGHFCCLYTLKYSKSIKSQLKIG